MPALALCLALLMLAEPTALHAQAIQDSRCYLMNGGAVESFFISEDTPVGSIIGTLSVNGDPRVEGGDITLSVQERGAGAGAGVAPGSKNVTLLRALDREERRGPASLYVNVRCDRRRSTDPSFIIPVSVRVWDVNDNAPAWVGAPYRVRLSELTAGGTRVLPALRATDADAAGPHATVRYSVLPGPHSEHFGFVNELDSVLVVKKPLDYETDRNFTVTLRAQDQGSPPLHNDTTLTVQVLDADDQNPRFSHDHYQAILAEDAKEGTILITSPGPISAADQDLGINAPLHYSTTGDNKHLVTIERDTGRVAATEELLDLVQPVTVVIKATQVDNLDRYALATLSVRRARPRGGSDSGGKGGGGGGGVRFSREQYSAVVSETAVPGTVLVTLTTDHRPHTDTHPDSSPPSVHKITSPLQFYVSDRSFLEKFAINSAGEVVLRRALDYETTDSYHYQVMVTDSNDTASINITVLDANEWEPRFRFPQYEFLAEADADAGAGAGAGAGVGGARLLRVGRLDAYDGDAADTLTLSLRGPDAHMLYVNASGDVYLRSDMLPRLNASALHAVATAVDSGSPPRQSSVPVIVHVGESLLPPTRAGVGGGGGGGVAVVVALFAAALVVLAALVCALLAYIYRVKRSKPPPTTKSAGFVSHEKTSPPTTSPPSTALIPTPIPVAPPTLNKANSGSLLSVSAGASTILANSNSSLDLRGDMLTTNGLATGSVTPSRQSQRFPRGRVAPAGGGGAGGGGGGGAGGESAAHMSDHLRLGAGGGRSGVAWPAATIPARVKKLSWDDAAPPHKEGAGSSPVHDATNPALADHMNLTVYF